MHALLLWLVSETVVKTLPAPALEAPNEPVREVVGQGGGPLGGEAVDGTDVAAPGLVGVEAEAELVVEDALEVEEPEDSPLSLDIPPVLDNAPLPAALVLRAPEDPLLQAPRSIAAATTVASRAARVRIRERYFHWAGHEAARNLPVWTTSRRTPSTTGKTRPERT